MGVDHRRTRSGSESEQERLDRAVSVIPANLGSHMFWDEKDPVRKSRKRRDFMMDVSLLGGLIIAAADTAGKPSLGWRGRRAAHRASEAVTLAAGAAGTAGLADKVGRGLQAGAEGGPQTRRTTPR